MDAVENGQAFTVTRDAHPRGLLDTNIMILRKWISRGELPAEMAARASAGRLRSGRAAAGWPGRGGRSRPGLAALITDSYKLRDGDYGVNR